MRTLFLEILEVQESAGSTDEMRRAILSALTIHSEGGGELLRKYMADTWLRTAPGVLREALHPIESQDDIEAALAAITTPTLIMRGNGELGSVLSPESSQNALAVLPRGEEAYFPRAGHAIHGSQPLEFVEAILRFQTSTKPELAARPMGLGSR